MKKLLAITLTLAMVLTLMSVATFTVSAEQTLIYRFTFENGGDTILFRNGRVGEIVEFGGEGNHALKYELNSSTHFVSGAHPYIWPRGIDEIIEAQGDLAPGESYELTLDIAYDGPTSNALVSYLAMITNDDYENYFYYSHFSDIDFKPTKTFHTYTFPLQSFDSAPKTGLAHGGLFFVDEAGMKLEDGYNIYIDNVTLVKNGTWKEIPENMGVSYLDGTPAEKGIVRKTETEPDYLYRVINNGTEIRITKYIGDGGKVAIPSAIEGLPVTQIGDYAFYNRSSLRDVTVPKTVTHLGKQAFFGCAKINTVTILGNITDWGEQAFEGCGTLLDVKISDGATCIGERAFCDCTLLTSVTIPLSLKAIGLRAFEGCYDLETVYYGGTENDRNNINIDGNNGSLINAKWVYEYREESSEEPSQAPSVEPSEEPSEEPSKVPSEEPSDPPVLPGDANGDGSTDMKDVLFARKFIAGMNVTVNEDALDVNRDGSVDMKDVLLMRKFIAGLIDHLG